MKYSKATLYGFLLSTAPSTVYASDPTGLYVLFVGFPAILLAITNIFIATKSPKYALILSVFLTCSLYFLIIWSSDVGYMDREGGYLILSCLLVGVSIAIAFINIMNKKQESWRPNYNWICSVCGVTNKKDTVKCNNCGNEI